MLIRTGRKENNKVKVKVKCFRVPDASARVEPELNPDFPPLSKH